jgi:hypothetical protein
MCSPQSWRRERRANLHIWHFEVEELSFVIFSAESTVSVRSIKLILPATGTITVLCDLITKLRTGSSAPTAACTVQRFRLGRLIVDRRHAGLVGTSLGEGSDGFDGTLGAGVNRRSKMTLSQVAALAVLRLQHAGPSGPRRLGNGLGDVGLVR